MIMSNCPLIRRWSLFLLPGALCLVAAPTFAQAPQLVEEFDQVELHYNADKHRATRDFRGTAPGYMTAGWWIPGQMKSNYVSWKTAVVPAKQAATFVFVGATSVLPSEFTRGPAAKLSVNGQYALTFTLGMNQDFTWKEGDYELRYLSKRVEFPYFSANRQSELNGNSGLYRLSVPATVATAGQPAVLKVEVLSFAAWSNGWFTVKEWRDSLKQSIESLEKELEAMRQDLVAVNQQTHILATQVYRKLLGSDRFEDEVIYNNGFRHVHPADLVPLQNGELLITWREATEHYAQDGDVLMMRSKDGGKT